MSAKSTMPYSSIEERATRVVENEMGSCGGGGIGVVGRVMCLVAYFDLNWIQIDHW